MNKKIIVANWKSNKTTDEAREFLDDFKRRLNSVNLDNKEIIISPSFTLLPFLLSYIRNNDIPIGLCAQNVSGMGEGAYTGEISSTQVSEFAKYTLVGHSERKRYNNESSEDVEKKVKKANGAGLKVILCIQDENSQVFDNCDVITYEPPSAISTFGIGKADDVERVRVALDTLQSKYPDKKLLYGGSVDHKNIKSYLEIENCSGFLIGSASLDPESFTSLLSQW